MNSPLPENEVRVALNKGVKLHNAGDFAGAEEAYLHALGLEPGNTEVLHWLALLKRDQGKLPESIELLRKAVAARPSDAQHRFALAQCLRMAGQLEEARQEISRAVQIVPSSPDFQFELANSMLSGPEVDREGALFHLNIALAIKPDFISAHINKSATLAQLGRYEEALASAREAVKLDPDNRIALMRLSVAIRSTGDSAGSEACLKRLVALEPGQGDAWALLSQTQYEQGHHEDALQTIGTALQLFPTRDDIWLVRSLAYRGLGRMVESEEAARMSVTCNPSNVQALANLAYTLGLRGEKRESLEYYRKAHALEPGNIRVATNLIDVLHACGEPHEGEALGRDLLARDPNNTAALNNFGNILVSLGKTDEAIKVLLRAIELAPDFAQAFTNLGNTYKLLNRHAESMAAYQRAVEVGPNVPAAWSNLGVAHQVQGNIPESIRCFDRALALQPDYAEAHSNKLFSLNFATGLTRQQFYEEHRRWGTQIGDAFTPEHPIFNVKPTRDRRLRIGYVSADFWNHAVGQFFSIVPERHDRSKFESICYADLRVVDAVTERIKRGADHWVVTTQMGHAQLAEQIRADGIDILVDLAGHTAHNRLLTFARKPAPVQMTWLGYPSGTGMKAMDWRIVDHRTEPEGQGDEFYIERLYRLQSSVWCYEAPMEVPDVNAAPVEKNGFVTFGSFNSFSKVTPDVLELWGRLMRACPTAHLLFVTVPEGPARERVIEYFGSRGIAADRLAFHGQMPKTEFLRMYGHVDVTLDPFPCNGATTTCESLYMGVPVITLSGKTYASRAGDSILNAARLPRFVAATEDDYIGIAAAVCANPGLITSMRSKLRQLIQGAPLMDVDGYVRGLEEAYRFAWEDWCNRMESAEARKGRT